MSKTALVAVLLASLSSCSSSPPLDGADSQGRVNLSQSRPGVLLTPGWINLKTLQVAPLQQRPEPGDTVLRGILQGGWFSPSGPVEGPLDEPLPGATPVPVWLRLSDRSIHTQGEGATPPSEPYLVGVFDRANELFYARERTVHPGVARPGARETAAEPR